MKDAPKISASEEAIASLQRRFESLATIACRRLSENHSVRRNLPGQGRLRIDRQLPFLCVYRSPPCKDPGTRELVTTEAAYLFASGKQKYHDGLSHLCQQINAAMQEHFGTFLILELWADPALAENHESPNRQRLAFEIVTHQPDSLPKTIQSLKQGLEQIKVGLIPPSVNVRHSEMVAPPELQPLDHACPERGTAGCCVIGIAVSPIYRDEMSGALYPMLLQSLRWQLAEALRKGVASFTGEDAGAEQTDFHAFGPTTLVKASRIVDQQLSEVAESFDFLLQVTPVNADAAWTDFQESGYQTTPTFLYRPLPYHPRILKRRLFEIEIERIEDPTLGHLFWEKQADIDRQLTALNDLETPNFLLSSQQLYGIPDDGLVALARDILLKTDRRRNQQGGDTAETCVSRECVPLREIVDRAREEIDYYHQQLPAFNAVVEVCDHIAAGIMVSRGRLLIASNLSLRPERIEPLLHHEIGTHLVTYYNGRTQPFRQLYTGLAGYEELQEGLAVLAEYLCGGLSISRIRSLASRVIAVDSVIGRSSFCETFQLLRDECGLSDRLAFVTSLRAHRGGGLTKDILYLRGLRDLLKYLEAGHELEPLYVGKIGLAHVPYVQELRRRGIIHPPALLPRFWNDELIRERLSSCRGLSILQLLEGER